MLPGAYLLGTFPSAQIVARSKGIDITTVGSGNPGASNIARTMGTTWGVAVFLLDAIKGTIPAVVGLLAVGPGGAYALVAAAVAGHMFPITRGFRGGKGVATVGGAMVVLQPVVFAALLLLWTVVRSTTGRASLGSLAIAAGLPIGVALTRSPGWEIAAAAALSSVVLIRHADNIKRLFGGAELAATRRPDR